MKIGHRIIYDAQTGKVLNGTFGEMSGHIQEGLRPEKIDYLDLPYGYNKNNFRDVNLYHIDVSRPKTAPIDERIVIDSYIKHEPSQVDVLGQALAQMKLKNIQQQSIIDGLGTELTKAKLEIIALKGGKSK